MFTTIGGWLVTRFGPSIFTKLLIGAIVLLLAVLIGFYVNNARLTNSLKESGVKIGTLEESLKTTKSELETANKNIGHYKDEITRLDKLSQEAEETRTVYVTVEKEVIREVIKYATNPNIARVNLPSEWVCIHDYASRGIDPFNSTGTTQSEALKFENYQCTQRNAVPDHEVIQAITYNYAQCRQMEVDYKELSDIVFGYLEKVNALEKQRKTQRK